MFTLVCADYHYVHHVLRSMAVKFEESQRAWVSVKAKDVPVVNALFAIDLEEENLWWDNSKAYREPTAPGVAHTGLYCVVDPDQRDALERWCAGLAIRVTCTAYPWSQDRHMAVLDCHPLTARWALANELRHF